MRALEAGLIVMLVAFPLASCDSTEPDVSDSFQAQLTGAAEVPPRITAASGSATFELNRDGTELRYTLTINNIQNLTMAHIHTGSPTENGLIVVYLFGPHGNPGVSSPAIVKTGVITAADLNPANFTGSFADFIQQIRVGNTYVNAHTTLFPGGEIRGQLSRVQ